MGFSAIDLLHIEAVTLKATVGSNLVLSSQIKKCELKEESSPGPKVIVRTHSKRFLLLIASGWVQLS